MVDDYTRLDALDAAPVGGRVAAIGVFDGVHLGHQRIIAEAVEQALYLGARPSVVTFYPHPEAVLRPGSAPRSLTLLGRKTELLLSLGVEEVVTVRFDLHFARLSPEAFCRMVLSARLGAKRVVVGENFRFGSKGAGVPRDLVEFGASHGFDVRAVPLVNDGSGPISSTRIRNLLSEGQVAPAAELLGRPHRLEGVVTRGAGRGRTLQAPTANLAVSGDLAIPGSGVYVTCTTVEPGASYQSVTSVGTNPTFEQRGQTQVETLLLDYAGDLYGSTVAVDFLERLRGQEVFSGAEALAEQIGRDVVAAREIHCRLCRSPGG